MKLPSLNLSIPTEEAYLLRCPEQDPKSSCWDASMAGKFIAIDQGSGGYFYAVRRIQEAQLFPSLEQALDYRRHWEWLEIYKLDLVPVRVDGETL